MDHYEQEPQGVRRGSPDWSSKICAFNPSLALVVKGVWTVVVSPSPCAQTFGCDIDLSLRSQAAVAYASCLPSAASALGRGSHSRLSPALHIGSYNWNCIPNHAKTKCRHCSQCVTAQNSQRRACADAVGNCSQSSGVHKNDIARIILQGMPYKLRGQIQELTFLSWGLLPLDTLATSGWRLVARKEGAPPDPRCSHDAHYALHDSSRFIKL